MNIQVRFEARQTRTSEDVLWTMTLDLPKHLFGHGLQAMRQLIFTQYPNAQWLETSNGIQIVME